MIKNNHILKSNRNINFHGTVNNELVAHIRAETPVFQMVNLFDIPDSVYFENGYVTRKIANIERICALNLLAEKYPVTLYTTSVTAKQRLRGVKIMSPICSEQDLHNTFRSSKINLNISLKGIEGGTPQRIMDIMGGGRICVNELLSGDCRSVSGR